jgi:glycosyltransferase involved in cell wall biosynthesis
VRGDWLSAMDGDDRWHPEKLEKEYLAIQNMPGAEIAYSNVRLIDQYGTPTQVWHDDRKGPPPTGHVFTRVFSRRFFNNTGSVFRSQLVSMKAMQAIGLYYDAGLNSFWDWDEKIRLTSKYQVAYSGGVYSDYRQHPGGMSQDRSDRNIVAMMKVYDKNKGLISKESLMDQIFVMMHAEAAINELGRSINRTQQEYTFEKIVRRLKDAIAGAPAVEEEVKRRAIAMIRPLYVHDVWEKINSRQNALALESWIRYLKEDPDPIDLQLNLPAQLHQVLQGTYRHKMQNKQ